MNKRFLSLAICILTMLWPSSLIFAQNSVSLDVHSASVASVLDDLVAQTGCSLYYTQPPVDLNRKVSVSVRNVSLQTALEKVFEGQGIDVQVKGDKVYLSEAPKPTPAARETVFSGTVTGSDALPVIGAAILVKATGDGTTTDIDGHYSLSARPGTEIEVSCMGYETKTLRSPSGNKLDIVLNLTSVQLEEVVMVGYSTRTREKLISSVSSIGGEKLVQSDVPNLENALSGKVSGVFSRQTSGEPGNDGADIRIRGFGSALVVVDGIPGRKYSDIDPNEIESVSVLKDASAAAVYGMQGANGVILVTTKRGSRSKPTAVEVTSKFGVQTPTRYPKAADSRLYQELLNEYSVNRRIITNHSYTALSGDLMVEDTQYDTDWYSLMIQPAPESRTNINVSGGSERMNWFVSGGYLYQGGIWSMNSTSKNRFNLRSNIDADIAEGLTASVSMGFVASECKYPGATSEHIGQAFGKASPLMPERWYEGSKYYAFAAEKTDNPLAISDPDASGYRSSSEHDASVDVALEYKIPWVEGLSLKANLGYTFETDYGRDWEKVIVYEGYRQGSNEYYLSESASYNDKADLTVYNSNRSDLLFQGYINYKRSFGAAHNINASLVGEVGNAGYRYFRTKRSSFPSSMVDRLDAALAGANVSDSEKIRTYHTASIVERFSYDYKSTYFIDINTRLDGAQYFARKWGFFPSVSLGWMMTNEPWMEGHKSVLKELKLRASYGVLGDLSDAKAYYDDNEMYYYQAGYRYPGTEMSFGDRTLLSLELTRNANPDFTWSTSRIANFGADFAFLSDRLLSGSIDVFYRSRDGLPAQKANDNSGDLATWYNLNSDSTRGLELSLNHQNRIGEVSYGATLNFSWSRTKYGHVEHIDYASGYDDWRNNLSGRWSNIRWGYKYTGRFASFEEAARYAMYQDSQYNTVILPGDLKYEDVNGDGYIDENDILPIGRTAYPEILYGLNLTASWKGFDLLVFLQGATLSQFTINAYDRFAFSDNKTSLNAWAYFSDRYRKSDYTSSDSGWVEGYFPATRDGQDPQVNKKESSFWMFDGTYLRVKNVELGYTFNLKESERFKPRLRVYLSAYNPLTLAAQSFFDPEVAENSYSFASYPQLKTWSVGVNLKF